MATTDHPTDWPALGAYMERLGDRVGQVVQRNLAAALHRYHLRRLLAEELARIERSIGRRSPTSVARDLRRLADRLDGSE